MGPPIFSAKKTSRDLPKRLGEPHQDLPKRLGEPHPDLPKRLGEPHPPNESVRDSLVHFSGILAVGMEAPR
jgi:hypothetical protein